MKRTLGLLVVLFCVSSNALAVRIGDVTRMDGERTNVLTGIGLVFGLKSTGDGGSFQPAVRPLAEMLANFSNAATVAELADAKNVAIVSLTARVPANGARAGDTLDVYVTSIGKATSLRGGRLFVAPMTGPIPGGGVLALAEGDLVLDDEAIPTKGVVRRGCVLEVDLPTNQIFNGSFTLILDDPTASWAMASLIARVINDGIDGQTWATAIDPKNVVVVIPPAERARPDSFISLVLSLQIPRMMSDARVTINDRTGTMILSGDVEISPVIISHKGLTISTIDPPPVPSARTPVTKERGFVAIDPANTGGARLQDLLNSLDQLKVPAEDKIAIVKELHRIGKLHAKLIVE